MEAMTDFIFLGSKITVGGEIKRHLLLGRKAVTNLDSILKSRDIITFPTKVHLVKAIVFPVVMYRCEDKSILNYLDSILQSRDMTLPTTKVHLVKAIVFPVVMYGCESWTIKKAECQRIDAFEL